MRLLLLCLTVWLTCIQAQFPCDDDSLPLHCQNCNEDTEEACEDKQIWQACTGPNPACRLQRVFDLSAGNALISVMKSCVPDRGDIGLCGQDFGDETCLESNNEASCFVCNYGAEGTDHRCGPPCVSPFTLECFTCVATSEAGCDAGGRHRPCTGKSPVCKHLVEKDNNDNVVLVLRSCVPDSADCASPVGDPPSCFGSLCQSCSYDKAKCIEVCPDGNEEANVGYNAREFIPRVIKIDGDIMSANDGFEGSNNELVLQTGDEIQILFLSETQVNGLFLETKCASKIIFKCYNADGELIIDPPITVETTFTDIFAGSRMIPQPAEFGVVRMTITFEVDQDCDNGKVFVKKIDVVLCRIIGVECDEDDVKSLGHDEFISASPEFSVQIQDMVSTGKTDGSNALSGSGESVILSRTSTININFGSETTLLSVTMTVQGAEVVTINVNDGDEILYNAQTGIEDGSLMSRVEFIIPRGIDDVTNVQLIFTTDVPATVEFEVSALSMEICDKDLGAPPPGSVVTVAPGGNPPTVGQPTEAPPSQETKPPVNPLPCRKDNVKVLDFKDRSSSLSVNILGGSHAGQNGDNALDRSGKSLTVTDNSDGTDYLEIDLTEPYTIMDVSMKVQFARTVTVTMLDSSGAIFDEVKLILDPSKSEELVFIPNNGAEDVVKIRVDFDYDTGEVLVKNIAIRICQECKEEDIITFDFNNFKGVFDLVIDGPSSNKDATQVLDKSPVNTVTLVSNNGREDKLILTFDKPTEVIDLSLRTQFGDRVTVKFFNLAGEEVYDESNLITDLDNKVSSVFTPPLGGVIEVKTIEFTFGYDTGEIKVKNLRVKICDEPAEPCVCRVRGDPILEPCKGGLMFLSGQTGYLLASSPISGCKWDVSIQTKELDSGSVIPVTMTIESYGYVLILDRNHDLLVDGAQTDLPWNSANPLFPITCEKENNKFLVCTIVKCDAKFGFWGQAGMSEGVLVIPDSVLGSVSGQCVAEP